MKFKNTEINEINNFFSRYNNQAIIKNLFYAKELWESRKDRVPSYKNGEWYTFGANLYLDLKNEDDWNGYQKKVEYFNKVLDSSFKDFYDLLLQKLKTSTGEEFKMANSIYGPLALPGFHIFPPHLALTDFFGHKHQDLQFNTLRKMPAFTFDIDDFFSGTYCIKLPAEGPHLLFGDKLQFPYTYDERSMVLHSGQFDHAIAPLQNPVTMFDWRITLQFHGFKLNGVNYLYW